MAFTLIPCLFFLSWLTSSRKCDSVSLLNFSQIGLLSHHSIKTILKSCREPICMWFLIPLDLLDVAAGFDRADHFLLYLLRLASRVPHLGTGSHLTCHSCLDSCEAFQRWNVLEISPRTPSLLSVYPQSSRFSVSTLRTSRLALSLDPFPMAHGE